MSGLLEAGPELDCLIGQQVFGVRVRRTRRGFYDLVIPGGVNSIDWTTAEAAWSGIPPYSADTPEGWAAMRAVLQHFAASGWQIDMWHEHGGDGGCWGAQLIRWGAQPQHGDRPSQDSTPICAPTLPHVVALAALAAVGAREGEE